MFPFPTLRPIFISLLKLILTIFPILYILYFCWVPWFRSMHESCDRTCNCTTQHYFCLTAQRLQLANVYKGEAEKILQVKKAEAEAEAKYLGGVGVAKQRQAITDGLRENILNFSNKVDGTSAKEVMDLIMVTQYFDTIKDLGNSSKNTTVFIPHGPGHVRDIGSQIRNGMMEAGSAQLNVE